MGLLWPTTQFEVTRSQYRKLHGMSWMTRVVPPCPIILQFHLDHRHICIYFRKHLLYQVSVLPCNGP